MFYYYLARHMAEEEHGRKEKAYYASYRTENIRVAKSTRDKPSIWKEKLSILLSKMQIRPYDKCRNQECL
jgi:hypothetical protein